MCPCCRPRCPGPAPPLQGGGDRGQESGQSGPTAPGHQVSCSGCQRLMPRAASHHVAQRHLPWSRWSQCPPVDCTTLLPEAPAHLPTWRLNAAFLKSEGSSCPSAPPCVHGHLPQPHPLPQVPLRTRPAGSSSSRTHSSHLLCGSKNLQGQGSSLDSVPRSPLAPNRWPCPFRFLHRLMDFKSSNRGKEIVPDSYFHQEVDDNNHLGRQETSPVENQRAEERGRVVFLCSYSIISERRFEIHSQLPRCGQNT